MTIDPLTKTIIGVVITCCIGISSGSLVLKGALPPDWIPYVTAWAGIIAFVGSAIQTALQGLGTTTTNRIAAAAAVSDVKQIVTTESIANSATFAPVAKVTSGAAA